MAAAPRLKSVTFWKRPFDHGEGATELIRIGQAVMAFHGKIDYFIDTVFKYPTLAECYKVAALDGMNRLPRPWIPYL